MVVAIRIGLSLIALYALGVDVYFCHWYPFGPDYWNFGCVAKQTGLFVGIPLAVALMAGYWKKSKPVFWNVFVGTFFVMTIGFYVLIQTF